MGAGREVYLLLGFDMETDVGSTSRAYEGVQRGTGSILQILKDNGVPATFLFTGDCALKNPNIVERVQAQGFEIGCHSLYHEDMGEQSFNTSSQGMVLEEELESRIRKNVSIMKKMTGIDPVSFRSPRGFASNNLMKILEKLRFKMDSSYMQSMHLKRNFPYFVSRSYWKEEGNGRILELPLFAFNLQNVADNEYQRILDAWPRLRTHGASFVFENMQPVIQKQIEENGFAALAFYLHPWEFYPMPKTQKYAEGTLHYDEFLYKNTGEAQCQELDSFIKLCAQGSMRFVDFQTFYGIFAGKKKRK